MSQGNFVTSTFHLHIHINYYKLLWVSFSSSPELPFCCWLWSCPTVICFRGSKGSTTICSVPLISALQKQKNWLESCVEYWLCKRWLMYSQIFWISQDIDFTIFYLQKGQPPPPPSESCKISMIRNCCIKERLWRWKEHFENRRQTIIPNSGKEGKRKEKEFWQEDVTCPAARQGVQRRWQIRMQTQIRVQIKMYFTCQAVRQGVQRRWPQGSMRMSLLFSAQILHNWKHSHSSALFQ